MRRATGSLRCRREGSCAICLEEFGFDHDDSWVELPCGHSFHKACVDEWLCRSAKCPFRCDGVVHPTGPLAARWTSGEAEGPPNKDALEFAAQGARRAAAAEALTSVFGARNTGLRSRWRAYAQRHVAGLQRRMWR